MLEERDGGHGWIDPIPPSLLVMLEMSTCKKIKSGEQDLAEFCTVASEHGSPSVLLLLLILLLPGCTTINVLPNELGELSKLSERVFVGAVKVRLPATSGHIQAVDVKTLGAGWQSGPFVGWNASNLVTADPAECQLLIVVRSGAEAKNAKEIISSLEGQNPCIVDYTRK